MRLKEGDTMLAHLFQSHEITLFMMLACFAVIISVAAVIVVTHLIPLNLRQNDNHTLGNIAALISLIYGVLGGLTALYLVNNIGATATAVQDEANAVVNIFRESKWLKDPVKTKMQQELSSYVDRVISQEWKDMRVGRKVSNVGDANIHHMSDLLSQYDVVTNSDKIVVAELLSEVRSLYNAREMRIAHSYSSLNPEIWAVVIVGTFLTIFISYLFGMNFYLHIISTSAVTLMAFAMIFLLITLDRPFQGEYVIQPDIFVPVANFIKQHPQ